MQRVALIAVAIGLATAAARAEEPKTLQDCIAIAIAQHPSLKAASASVQAGNQRVLQAESNYLPQITGFYDATRQRSNLSQRTNSQGVTLAPANTFNFYKTGVGFTQILFDFGQQLNSIRAAQASEQSLEADFSTQQDTVVLNVKQAYFNMLATRRLLGVADETVHQNEKHVEQAQGRFSVGVAAKFDVTQAQVQLAQAELNQVSARNNVAVARETLRNALGLIAPIDFDIVDNFDVHTLSISEDNALSLAYDKRPELQSLQAQERSTTEQIASLQKGYLPNLTGNGQYVWSASDYPLASSWMVTAAVNLSIFNGGLTTAQVGEQKANLANLKYNEELERENIGLEVRQDVLNLQQSAESIRVSEKGLQQARENLEIAEGR